MSRSLHPQWNQRIPMWGFLMSIVVACTPARGGINPPPVVPDTLPSDRPTEIVTPVFNRPRLLPATYHLTTKTLSEDKGAGIRDSAQQVRRVLIQPVPSAITTSSLRITFDVDSSVPAGTPIDTGRTYNVNADGVFQGPVAIPTCTSGVSAASVLYSRLLVPRYSAAWPVTDSLSYETCIRNVRSRVSSTVTWMTPTADAAVSTWTQSVRIIGSLAADSTRMLPMQLSGILNGSITLTYPIDTTLVSRVTGQLSFVLNAKSSTRQQRVEQTTSIEAVRR